MTDEDRALRDTFARYARSVLAAAPPPDEATVRGIARRRHVRRVALLVAAVVAAMVLPLAVVSLVDGDGGRGTRPPIEPVPPVPVSVNPTAGGNPSPASSPSPHPGTGSTRLTVDVLAHSTLTLPPWPTKAISPCPSGRVTMDGNPTAYPDDTQPGHLDISIEKIAYADLDGDGATEAAALVACTIQHADYEVLVLEDEPTGIRTTATVVQTPASGIESVSDLRANGGSAIDIEVGDGSACCGVNARTIEHQWRTYGWTGSALAQIAGPTTFHPVPPATDLAITGTGLSLGPPTHGTRHESFTITFTNRGPYPAPGVLLLLTAYGWEHPLRAEVTITVDGITCSADALPGYLPAQACHLNPLPVGATRTLTIRVASPVANDTVIPVSRTNSTDPGVAADVVEEQPGIRSLTDPTPGDNSFQTALVRSG